MEEEVFNGEEFLNSYDEENLPDIKEEVYTEAIERSIEESSTVSENELHYRILEELSRLNEKENITNEYLERLLSVTSDNSIRDSVSVNNVPDYTAEHITVSESSIIDKPINEYNVQEGLLLMIVVGLFMGGIVLIVKKGVGRWR